MSTTHSLVVPCPSCGASQDVLVPESANVQRAAVWRERVLDGSFMRFTCDACAAPFVVEQELLYTDLPRGVFVMVVPRAQRDQHAALAPAVEAIFRRAVTEEAPAFVSQAFAQASPRLVFGYAELREKVVCADAGLDDRLVEALKLMLLGRLRSEGHALTGLTLTSVAAEPAALVFATEPATDDARDLAVDAAVYADLARDPERIARMLPALFAGPYVHHGNVA